MEWEDHHQEISNLAGQNIHVKTTIACKMTKIRGSYRSPITCRNTKIIRTSNPHSIHNPAPSILGNMVATIVSTCPPNPIITNFNNIAEMIMI